MGCLIPTPHRKYVYRFLMFLQEKGLSSNNNAYSLCSSGAKRTQKRHDSDSDQSPPRKKTHEKRASDSDQSPPRMRPRTSRGSDSDQSPPRRRPCRGGKESDEDLSPPRRPSQKHVSWWNSCMLANLATSIATIDGFVCIPLRVRRCFLVGKQVWFLGIF